MEKASDWVSTVSPKNSGIARIAALLVAAAVRHHGTIEISSLTAEEWAAALKGKG